jgi:uncharacterized membrane protein
MYMILLVLGVVLWTIAHLFKRLRPAQRAAMGDKGKGLATVGILAGLVLMIVGYRGAEFINVWYPPAFMVHLNNLLMLVGLYIFFAGGAKVWLGRKIRHAQLTGVKTWAIAHLLVNGDLASILLFGGMLVWAVLSVILINKADRAWTPAAPQGALREVIYGVGVLVAFGVITMIHVWLGVSPFPG